MKCAKCGQEDTKAHLTNKKVGETKFSYYACVEAILQSSVGVYVVPTEIIQRMQEAETTAQDIVKIIIGIVRTRGIQTPQGMSMTILAKTMADPGHVNVNVNGDVHQITVTDKPLIAQEVIRA